MKIVNSTSKDNRWYARQFVTARSGGPVIGRNKSPRSAILARRTKITSPCRGRWVGKTAVVEGLAQAIVNVDIPCCKNKIISIDISGLTVFNTMFEAYSKLGK